MAEEKKESPKADLREFDFDEIMTDDLSTPSAAMGSADGSASDDANQEKALDLITENAAPQVTESQEVKTGKNGKQKKQKRIDKNEWMARQRRKKRTKRERVLKVLADIFSWLKDIALCILIVWIMTTFVAGFIKVDNTSMSPTLNSGEYIIYSRFSYLFTDPARGEIVVFTDTQSGRAHIARVIGLPGDVVVIDTDGNITVNGIAFETAYSDGTTTYVANQMTYPYTVPEDSYFVLCDNPVSTTDSRFLSIGAVTKSQIQGKVFFCFWPRESWRVIVQGLISNE